MEVYKNKNGDSGITHFELGEDHIQIKFQGKPWRYLYSDELNGKSHIEKMKVLARAGKGLGTYISQHPEVRDHFEKR